MACSADGSGDKCRCHQHLSCDIAVPDSLAGNIGTGITDDTTKYCRHDLSNEKSNLYGCRTAGSSSGS